MKPLATSHPSPTSPPPTLGYEMRLQSIPAGFWWWAREIVLLTLFLGVAIILAALAVRQLLFAGITMAAPISLGCFAAYVGSFAIDHFKRVLAKSR